MKKFFKGFYHAFIGIQHGFRERNMIFHGVVAVCVFAASFVLKISLEEWILVLLFVGLVLTAEMFNTSIEEVCNRIRDDLGLSYEATRKARDVSAGAVLVISIIAALVGILIFGPKIFDLISIQ